MHFYAARLYLCSMGQPKIDKPAKHTVEAVSKPKDPKVDPISKAAPPKKPSKDDKSNVPEGQSDQLGRKFTRKTSQENFDRKGTHIHFISIDLTTGRVAFETRSGPPLRGYISTDIEPGYYQVQADVGSKQWRFIKSKVKSGLRFVVDELVGIADPFQLTYDDPVTIFVIGDETKTSRDPVAEAKKQFLEKVNANTTESMTEAFQILDNLSEVSMYDAIDELFLEDPNSLPTLLWSFLEVKREDPDIDLYRVRRAIEAFTLGPSKLYIDTFDEVAVNDATFKVDAERTAQGKGSLLLEFTYKLQPLYRSILVYGDDIFPDTWTDPELPEYRLEGDLLYPKYLTRGSTPRIYQAKLDAIKQINENLTEIVGTLGKESFKTVAEVALFAAPLIAATPAAMSGGARNLVTIPLLQQGAQLLKKSIDQGVWIPSPQNNENMKKSAAEYEAKWQNRPKNVKKGSTYFFNDVWWDGVDIALNILIECKSWLPKGRQIRGLEYFFKNPGSSFGYSTAQGITEAIERQRVAVPDGVRVEYRMACQEGVDAMNRVFEEMDSAYDEPNRDIQKKFYAVLRPP